MRGYDGRLAGNTFFERLWYSATLHKLKRNAERISTCYLGPPHECGSPDSLCKLLANARFLSDRRLDVVSVFGHETSCQHVWQDWSKGSVSGTAN